MLVSIVIVLVLIVLNGFFALSELAIVSARRTRLETMAKAGNRGAQLVEPYVDPEVSWAIRAHQALRFYPDESAGYTYPETYRRIFGEDFKPEPYIGEAYKRALNNRWYLTGRLITVNDLYSFDPNAEVSLEEFTDVVGRHFKQPKEGLGFDGSPSAHMWRTMIWPTKYL